jgi:hypothetical protein
MMKRSLLRLSALALAFILAGCEPAPPEVADVKAEFHRRYPTVEVVSIRMSEDEVVARRFEVTYRRRGAQESKSITLQSMKGEKGAWEFRPGPPTELP